MSRFSLFWRLYLDGCSSAARSEIARPASRAKEPKSFATALGMTADIGVPAKATPRCSLRV